MIADPTTDPCAAAEVWSDEVRLELASAVSRPGSLARILAPDNTSPRCARIEAAVLSGSAFSVQVREDIVVWDIDKNLGLQPLILLLTLQEAGFRPIQVASGQQGHLHIFVRCADAAQRERVVLLGREILKLKPQAWIRPPLCPHRLGAEVRLVSDTPSDALAALLDPPPNGGRDMLPEPVPTTPPAPGFSLEHETKWALRTLETTCANLAMTPEGGRHDLTFRSARLIGGYVAGGELDESIATGRLIDAALDAGLEASEAERTVQDGLACGQRDPLHVPSLYTISEVWAASAGTIWPGKEGDTEWRVLIALLGIALDAVSDRPCASHRYIAERAGRTKNATSAALDRLVSAGWLARLGSNAMGTTTWQLRVPENANDPVPDQPPSIEMERLIGRRAWAHPGEDMWRQGGLGGALLVYHRLVVAPMAADELAASLGRARKTVAHDLQALLDEGLIEEGADGRFRALPPVDSHAVAARLGTAGRGERQRCTHRSDRDAWKRWLTVDIPFVMRPKGSRFAGGQVGLGMSQADAIAYAHAHGLEITFYGQSQPGRAPAGADPTDLAAARAVTPAPLPAPPDGGWDVRRPIRYAAALPEGVGPTVRTPAPPLEPSPPLEPARAAPLGGGRPLQDVAAVTGVARWSLAELVPLASHYPRAKVGDPLEALDVAHVGLRQAPDLPDPVMTTLTKMWTSGS